MWLEFVADDALQTGRRESILDAAARDADGKASPVV